MNLINYTRLISHNVNWLRENVEDIPLKNIKVAEEVGQVRQGGTINSHIDELVESIGYRGQLVPVTIESADGDGFYTVADGNHRIKAMRILHKKYPKNLKYSLVRTHVRTFQNETDKVKWQSATANEHLPSRKNTTNDIVYVIKKLMASGCKDVPMELQGGEGNKTYLASPERYIGVLKGYLETNYSFSARDRTRIAREVVKNFPNQKLCNYSTSEVKDAFAKNNSIGWEVPTNNAKTFNGWQVLTLGESSHVFPNITGNSFKAKTVDGSTNTCVVLWDSNPFGKTGTKLDELRRQMIGYINMLNTSSLLKDGIRLINKIFITPQKIGSEIKEEGFYEISPNDEGTFGSNAFPNEGWVI